MKNKNLRDKLISTGFFVVFLALSQPVVAERQPTLVIIIDDIGYNLENGIRAARLPGKLNLAVLPGTPNSRELAILSAAMGKEVVLHAPMSNVHQRPLGPCALTADMNERTLRRTLSGCLEATPHVRGVSNHMGSQLTSMREPMEWVMQELVTRNLYYVDSRTHVDTQAATVAAEYGIPHMSRQIFLDNDATRGAIHTRFQQLLALADHEGLGVAIGHPYPETLDYLQQALPALSANGYRLALISEVLQQSYVAATAPAIDRRLTSQPRLTNTPQYDGQP